jgi:hypothetical protein
MRHVLLTCSAGREQMGKTESGRRAGAEPERCTAAGLLCPLLHPEAQYSVHTSDVNERSDDG